MQVDGPPSSSSSSSPSSSNSAAPSSTSCAQCCDTHVVLGNFAFGDLSILVALLWVSRLLIPGAGAVSLADMTNSCLFDSKEALVSAFQEAWTKCSWFQTGNLVDSLSWDTWLNLFFENHVLQLQGSLLGEQAVAMLDLLLVNYVLVVHETKDKKHQTLVCRCGFTTTKTRKRPFSDPPSTLEPAKEDLEHAWNHLRHVVLLALPQTTHARG